MAAQKLTDMTVHQLKSVIGNLDRRKREINARIKEMEIELLLRRSKFKVGDVVIDRNGRKGIVAAPESDFLRVRLLNNDGSVGGRLTLIYYENDWDLVEAEQGREE